MLKVKVQSGFTLIELLTIIGIMAILAAILLGSQYAIREQIYLFQDQYKITNVINEAKNLTLGAFQREPDVCGYGVSFEYSSGGMDNKVILYKDKKKIPSEVCNSDQHEHEYNQDIDEKVSESSFDLNKTEQFRFGGDISKYAVVFNAPSLKTFLTENDSNVSDSIGNIKITLHALKSGAELSVNINKFGQVITE